MRVLAIGATGFIGRHAVRQLAARGHQVTVMHRGSTPPPLPTGVRELLGDRDRMAEVRPELALLAPDVVLDMIAYTGPQAEGLVGALRGVAGRLVVASSADVYRNYDGFRGQATAPPDPVPLTEDSPLRDTRYPYRGYDLPLGFADDYDKIVVEAAVLSDPGLPAAVLRLPAVYGPGDNQRRLHAYLRRMDDGRPAILLGHDQARWRWTRGYVENVAAALTLAVESERSAGRVYNVGEEGAPTEREWVERIGAAAGWRGDVVTAAPEQLPASLRQPYDWRYDLAVSTRRVREELDFREPVAVAEGLRHAVEWERSQPDRWEPPDYAAEDAALAAIAV